LLKEKLLREIIFSWIFW